MRLCLCTATIALLLTPLALTAWAESPRTSQASAVSRVEDDITKHIRHVLQQPTSIDFVETPLGEAMQYFEDFHQIQIHIDRRALEQIGIGTDTPISQNLENVCLRSALNLMLGELDLTYVVRDQVLVITTIEAAQDQQSTRVYAVADLVKQEDGTIDFAPLVDTITFSIHPKTWDEAGGPGSIVAFRNLLVISQTEAIHEQIENLLLQLRSQPEAGHDVPADDSLGAAAPSFDVPSDDTPSDDFSDPFN